MFSACWNLKHAGSRFRNTYKVGGGNPFVGFWLGRRVFITGASGFIAPWLAGELLSRGAEVTALLRPSDEGKTLKLRGILGRVRRVNGDVSQPSSFEALRSGDFDTCFHLAARSGVQDGHRFPVKAFEANVVGTLNFLEACRASKSTERVVVASSDKVYGEQPKMPCTEDMPLLGSGPYEASKACAEMLSHSYVRSYGLPINVTRCANTYGGGDLSLSRLVPGTIVSILRGETPVIRSDGKAERDYVYVTDTVAAYLSLAEKTGKGGICGEAFNFGSGKPVTVLGLFRLILRTMGSSAEPKVLNQAGNEIRRQFLDSTKAKRVLGWEPRVTLEKGIHETVAWYAARITELL